jgi:hypothetical protein
VFASSKIPGLMALPARMRLSPSFWAFLLSNPWTLGPAYEALRSKENFGVSPILLRTNNGLTVAHHWVQGIRLGLSRSVVDPSIIYCEGTCKIWAKKEYLLWVVLYPSWTDPQPFFYYFLLFSVFSLLPRLNNVAFKEKEWNLKKYW